MSNRCLEALKAFSAGHLEIYPWHRSPRRKWGPLGGHGSYPGKYCLHLNGALVTGVDLYKILRNLKFRMCDASSVPDWSWEKGGRQSCLWLIARTSETKGTRAGLCHPPAGWPWASYLLPWALGSSSECCCWREALRWWNWRMKNLPLLTSILRIYLQMEQLSQSTCWKLAENLRHQKGQEKSPHNQVGWEKEKKENTGRDQHLWKGAEGERFSYSEKSICCGKISKGRKGPSEDQRGTQQPMCERQENVRTVHTWSGL